MNIVPISHGLIIVEILLSYFSKYVNCVSSLQFSPTKSKVMTIRRYHQYVYLNMHMEKSPLCKMFSTYKTHISESIFQQCSFSLTIFIKPLISSFFVLLKLNYNADVTSTFPLQVKLNLMEEFYGRKWINRPDIYSKFGDCIVGNIKF
jgi:hypothetical protein